MGLHKIEELVNNINKYNDTVIVIGKDVVSKGNNIFKVDEESKKIFNRKTLIKDPKKYWSFYYLMFNEKRVFTDEEKAISKLIEKLNGNVKIINNTSLSLYSDYKDKESIDVSGDINKLTCIGHHHIIDANEFFSYAKEEDYKCLECGAVVKPTVLMYGEQYDPILLKKLESLIADPETKELKTHNIIFIGADFDDDLIHSIIESFKALKIAQEKENEKFFSVMITDHKGIEITRYEPDFGTSDEIVDSIERLIKLM